MSGKPNILWICTEHQRFDTIRALGNPHIRTPNLDRLVEEGVAFTHAYCQNPVCVPSRTSFLTGRYPAANRIRQNGQNISEDEVLITRTLRDQGYDCALAGKLHVRSADSGWESRVDDGYRKFHWSHGTTAKHGGEWVNWLAEQGKTFQDVYQRSGVPKSRRVSDRRYHQTTWCVDRALDFMKEERDGPWLVSLNPFAVHDPFDYLDEYFERYDIDALPLPAYREGELGTKPSSITLTHRVRRYDEIGAQRLRQMVAAYYATIEHLDAEIGRLLDWLYETGERENTLIIFTSDHGEPLGDHGVMIKGSYFYEGCVRVPLIFSWPGTIPQGCISNALVELVDIAPTIHELLGDPVPRRMQGRSLKSLLMGKSPLHEHREGVYSEYYNSTPPANAPDRYQAYQTMWRDRRYKIVVYHNERLGELYDLENDPQEFENLWDDPRYSELRFEMMKRCFDARVFTMDPMPERMSGF